jgi:hypothetical protein
VTKRASFDVAMFRNYRPRLAVHPAQMGAAAAGHVSFASAHPGKRPFETIKLACANQVLWPDHGVQGTDEAAIHKGIDIPQAELIIRKGYHSQVDSHSAFVEADQPLPRPFDPRDRRPAGGSHRTASSGLMKKERRPDGTGRLNGRTHFPGRGGTTCHRGREGSTAHRR